MLLTYYQLTNDADSADDAVTDSKCHVRLGTDATSVTISANVICSVHPAGVTVGSDVTV